MKLTVKFDYHVMGSGEIQSIAMLVPLPRTHKPSELCTCPPRHAGKPYHCATGGPVIVRGYEIAVDGDGVVAQPFYMHGSGYHTLCSLSPEQREAIERIWT